MTRTSDRRSNPGPRTTTEHARIPALDPECRTRILGRPNFRSNGIAFLRTTALPRLQSWAISITNTNWRRSQHEESGISYLRRTRRSSIAAMICSREFWHRVLAMQGASPLALLYQDCTKTPASFARRFSFSRASRFILQLHLRVFLEHFGITLPEQLRDRFIGDASRA